MESFSIPCTNLLSEQHVFYGSLLADELLDIHIQQWEWGMFRSKKHAWQNAKLQMDTPSQASSLLENSIALLGLIWKADMCSKPFFAL